MDAIARLIAWLGIPLGIVLLWLGSGTHQIALAILLSIFGALLLLLGLLFSYWYLRPNRAVVKPELKIEAWDAVADGWHNSNTDMIYWREAFYLVHAAAPFHFASQKCHLVLHRSPDAKTWEKIAEFYSEGEDIRDPKLAPIGRRLFLYALVNRSFDPEPYTTVYASSQDGVVWSAFQKIDPQGWLFWRPKTSDGVTWYVPAYWWEHGKSVLFRSQDGESWSLVSTIYTGDRNDETAIEFLPDGRLIATARLEFSFDIFGDRRGSTLIAVAEPPFESWQALLKSPVTRLDGPTLFTYKDRVFAAGRHQPEIGLPFARQGSVTARKRTALYEVRQDGLAYLSDLPSAGDTAYTGVVLRNGQATISYYSSDVQRDVPWILGMTGPTNIKIARVDLEQLAALAERTPAM
jgi:hypothetical protein